MRGGRKREWDGERESDKVEGERMIMGGGDGENGMGRESDKREIMIMGGGDI
jgi:hypothetical protein